MELTATEYEVLRSEIEATHNKNRDDREKQYISDREALESEFRSDLTAIQQDKIEALMAAGLNSDGSNPQGRQQG